MKPKEGHFCQGNDESKVLLTKQKVPGEDFHIQCFLVGVKRQLCGQVERAELELALKSPELLHYWS